MTLSANFAFLKVYNPQLAQLGTQAEDNLYKDPNTCLFKLRLFGEQLAQQVAAKKGLYVSEKEQQCDLLNRLRRIGLLNDREHSLLHELRIGGNKAVHNPEKIKSESALTHLEYAHELGVWYNKSSPSGSDVTPKPFVPPKAPVNVAEGYVNVSKKREIVALALQNIATFIGTPQEKSITLESGEVISPGVGATTDAALLSNCAKEIQKGIFKLLVLGEFKHGKSTLLNAMIGSKKLPAKTTPATAVISVLVYGNSQQVTIYEKNREEPQLISWESFIKEFQLGIGDQETLAQKKSVDRFKNIQYAQIECQNPLCQNGVRLIDSPGLAEHASRTQVTTNFLQQSQAVIFVLNATQPLSQDEREFIEKNITPGNAQHVFFVVNRINLVDEEEVEEVRAFFQGYLQDYFVDSDGAVDAELCGRRIFFVNAKGALNARQSTPVNEQQLKESGVPSLERELEQFLTTGQRISATLNSTIELLIPVISKTRQKIKHNKQALSVPLNKLEERKVAAEARLQALKTKEDRTRRTILTYSEIISTKLCINLEGYIYEMEKQWDEDFQAFNFLNSYQDALDFIKAILDEQTRKLIAKNLQENIQRYLEQKFNTWSEQSCLVVQDELHNLTDKLEAEIKDFAQELTNIEHLFSEGVTQNNIDLNENREQKILQLLVNLILGDFSQMTGTVMGDGDWSNFIWNSIKQVLIVTTVLAIFGGPIEWLLLIIIEVSAGFKQFKEAKEKIGRRVGEEIFRKLKEQLPDMKKAIRDNTQVQFQKVAKEITRILHAQIIEVSDEQTRIIQQKREQCFSIEREKQRLERIENAVLAQFIKISQLADDKTHSVEEIEWIAKGRTLINGGEPR